MSIVCSADRLFTLKNLEGFPRGHVTRGQSSYTETKEATDVAECRMRDSGAREDCEMARLGKMLWVVFFLILLLLTAFAFVQSFRGSPAPEIRHSLTPGDDVSSTLFVYVHGLERGRHWQGIREVLSSHGDILRLSYLRPSISSNNPKGFLGVF